MQTSRRALIRTGLVAGAAVALSAPQRDTRATAAATMPVTNPFTLGVASGDPSPDGMVLWTRLAVAPLADNGLGGMSSSTYSVRWQVGTDERLSKIVRLGTVEATAANAHSVHVDLSGLSPGREYFYRFKLGPYSSRIGRTRTAPSFDSTPGSLAMSFVSCASYERGWFTAYRRLAEDHPDLVLHLGDYQYEYPQGGTVGNTVRDVRGPETKTLANYRQRHAQYRTDPDLQAAHAVAPWLVVFDDHEVENNWADEIPELPADAAGFRNRRAAAFKAYYEHMPLRRASIPSGPDMQLYRRLQWGRLANFHMLDTRQYRSDQACSDGWKDCPPAADPTRSITGAPQEQWLADGFANSRASWDLIGQQVFFSRRARAAMPDNTRVMDSWDGYPASRARVTDAWVRAQVRNPVVLTGDVHAHWVSDVVEDFNAPDSPVVGTEFVTSSITSGADGYDEPTGQHPWAAYNPNLQFWTNLRGYVNTRITPQSLTVDYRCVPRVTVKGAAAFTRARFVIDDGVRGVRQTYDSPAQLRSAMAPASNAQKIRDTLETESE